MILTWLHHSWLDGRKKIQSNLGVDNDDNDNDNESDFELLKQIKILYILSYTINFYIYYIN